jgi:2-polyprenyl-3-methyl-5-hydroxy-6-metoxy-1,4-benzoquinol methylase
MSTPNTRHWDKMGEAYNHEWQSIGRQAISAKERGFVREQLEASPAKRGLDIGVGTGRILSVYVDSPKVKEIYGLDIAESMVKLCQQKYQNNQKVKDIRVVDVAKQGIPYAGSFDFISAVRVLKYNENWRDTISQVSNHLSPDGLFLFTMPNYNSITRFLKYKIIIYRTTSKEIRDLCDDRGLELISLVGFAKIPDRIYSLSNNPLYVNTVLFAEHLLECLFGKIMLGRELFIVVKRKRA